MYDLPSAAFSLEEKVLGGWEEEKKMEGRLEIDRMDALKVMRYGKKKDIEALNRRGDVWTERRMKDLRRQGR